MGYFDVDVIGMILDDISTHATNQNIICFFLKFAIIAAETKAPFQDMLKRQLLKPVVNLLEIVKHQSDDNINLMETIIIHFDVNLILWIHFNTKARHQH